MNRLTLLASAAALALPLSPLSAQDHSAHAGHGTATPAPTPAPAPTPEPVAPPTPAPMDHMMHGMDHGAMNHGTMDHSAQAGHAMPSTPDATETIEYIGPNPRYLNGCTSMALVIGDSNVDGTICRPAAGSGTSRLPGAEGMMHGLHFMPGDDWMIMAHGNVTTAYTDHGGPRGDDKAYVTSMGMVSGERQTAWGRIQLKSMFSLEPAMDSRGYPNLFATGETSRGEPLVDRQHPHDLFMELAARVDVNVGAGSLFLYGGPVGEPAIGPSAFMHRGSAAMNPEPPITHHWFDSTHITYGVVTAGYTSRFWQLEASAFRGREPDERRWNIETPALDSWAVRATVNPTDTLAMQVSHARIKEPEAQHPGEDEARTTASIHYANHSGLSAMLAFSAKNRLPGDTLTAWLGEVNWDLGEHHTLFGRFENVANDEFFPDHHDPLHDVAFRVSKYQAGYAYRLPLTDDLGLALGGSVSAYAKPDALDAAYGDSPMGYTLFMRLTLGG